MSGGHPLVICAIKRALYRHQPNFVPRGRFNTRLWVRWLELLLLQLLHASAIIDLLHYVVYHRESGGRMLRVGIALGRSLGQLLADVSEDNVAFCTSAEVRVVRCIGCAIQGGLLQCVPAGEVGIYTTD